MKKVLVIAPYAYLPYYSGGQKFIARFLHHLGQKTDLTVISVAESDISLASTYKIIPLLKKSFSRYYDSSLVKKITAVVKERGIDTVIWEHPYYAWLAFRIRKRTGVKTMIHTHNIEYRRFKSTGRWWWPFLKWYEKRCFRKADGIFFISPEDKDFAITKWGIAAFRCFDLPFGVDISEYPGDRAESRVTVCRKHAIPENEKILLFTGAFNYKPNHDALQTILEEINPRLLSERGLSYKIIICGKGLSENVKNLRKYSSQNIIYAGFVSDIETYYKAADIVLNPVISGGGVKTKVVEAIAFGTTVISTESGAAGMDRNAAGKKLIVVKDSDWEKFGEAIINNSNAISSSAAGFYNIYSWKKIIQRIIIVL